MLAHRIPYPPNKGDKIRSYQMLRHLSQHYEVALGAFVDDPDDWRHRDALRPLCAESYFGALDRRAARLRSLRALAGSGPLSLAWYRDAAMHAWVADVVRRTGTRRIVVFSSVMAQYAQPHHHARRVVDFCDVDSDKWRQYAQARRGPLRWIYAREARTLLAYERSVAKACDAALFVCAPEAELFRRLAPESAKKTTYFNIGVDTAYFSPAREYRNPFVDDVVPVVFCGAMDYWPNVDAAAWFAAEVVPAVKRACPRAVFYVVGARPTQQVKKLAAEGSVVVTGAVADVRPYLAHAAVCVAPMRIARGVQTKVLEAMAMARPVVVSGQALEGIGALPDSEVLVASDAQGFAGHVLRAITEPDPRMGRAARLAVRRRFSWDEGVATVRLLLEGGGGHAPR